MSRLALASRRTGPVMDAYQRSSPLKRQTLSVLNLNGTNGSTTIVDRAGFLTWTVNGSAALSTTQAKYGASSLRTGAGAYLVSSAPSELGFGTGDYWFSMWLWPDASQVKNIIGFANVFVLYQSGLSLRIYDGSFDRIVSSNIAATAWSLVEFGRINGITLLRVNGVIEGTTPGMTGSIAANPIYVGTYTTPSAEFEGYIDDFVVLRPGYSDLLRPRPSGEAAVY